MSIPLFTTKYHPCPATPVGLGRQISVVISVLSAVIFLSFAFNVNAGSVINKAPTSLGLITGLVGYWSFDGPDMAGVTAFDRSGQGNNGTLTNGPVRKAGRIGQALEFDGVNDWVDMGAAPTVRNFSQYTASMWFNLSGIDADNVTSTLYWESINVSSNVRFKLMVNGVGNAYGVQDNSLTFRFRDTDAATPININSTHDIIKLNTWHHAVAVFDSINDVQYLYLDGSLVASGSNVVSTVSNTAPADTIKIGQEGAVAGDESTIGLIDDVRIYNRALSSDEIKRLYKIGATFKINTSINTGTLQNGLVGYWSFDGPDMAGESGKR